MGGNSTETGYAGEKGAAAQKWLMLGESKVDKKTGQTRGYRHSLQYLMATLRHNAEPGTPPFNFVEHWPDVSTEDLEQVQCGDVVSPDFSSQQMEAIKAATMIAWTEDSETRLSSLKARYMPDQKAVEEWKLKVTMEGKNDAHQVKAYGRRMYGVQVAYYKLHAALMFIYCSLNEAEAAAFIMHWEHKQGESALLYWDRIMADWDNVLKYSQQDEDVLVEVAKERMTDGPLKMAVLDKISIEGCQQYNTFVSMRTLLQQQNSHLLMKTKLTTKSRVLQLSSCIFGGGDVNAAIVKYQESMPGDAPEASTRGSSSPTYASGSVKHPNSAETCMFHPGSTDHSTNECTLAQTYATQYHQCDWEDRSEQSVQSADSEEDASDHNLREEIKGMREALSSLMAGSTGFRM